MRHPLRASVACFVACLTLLAASPSALAYPKPSVYPVSWQLKTTHGTPKRIAVHIPGTPQVQTFWYVVFTVVNNSGEDQQFLPACDLVTKDGQVVRSDRNIPVGVFEAIQKREGRRLLEPLSKATGRILQGEDQARDTVAIWPEPADPRLEDFQIFITGLSGEAVLMQDGKETTIADWTKISEDDRAKLLMLRKTLELHYHINGDKVRFGEEPAVLASEDWVMR